jgi:flagellar biosynthesis/type III secretory pathway protein FliH
MITEELVHKATFDGPWKGALNYFFKDFMALCWPEKNNLIDWEKGHTFLDQELLKIDPEAATSERRVDKLIELHCQDGALTYLLLHIEIERSPKSNFNQRMFQYFYRLSDRYDVPIASLAILIDENPGLKAGLYKTGIWGSELEMKFPVIKILDYRQKKADLEASNNRFAPIILSQLAACEKQDAGSKLITKIALTRQLYQHGWSREDVLNIHRFLDFVLVLPPALDLNYVNELKNIEQELQVEYITSVERVGIEKGLQQGLQQGMQQGMQQGIQQGEMTILLRQLEQKFKEVPAVYREQVQNLDSEALLRVATRLLECQSLDELLKQ